VVVDSANYDWEATHPCAILPPATVIYEMHVRGFSGIPSSGRSPKTRGTYAGLIEKIPYLQELGITAVELLPVFQFDARTLRPAGQLLGYSPVSFLRRIRPTVHGRTRRPGQRVSRHGQGAPRAGINHPGRRLQHTAEGIIGAHLSFRGFRDDAYYIREQDRSRFAKLQRLRATRPTPIIRSSAA